MFKGKNVLVAGGTGLIGRPLVGMLVDRGANVRVASLDDASRAHPGTEFRKTNLLVFRNCLDACDGMDFVFNLLGVKGSPAVTVTRPASFFVPTLMLDTNMMEAARQRRVRRFLFTSSIGVYAPAELFREEDVWRTFPSPYDRFAGWAKRMGELQADAYRLEHGWKGIAIVRPANVYGPYDNFDLDNAMVVPSLIRRAVSGEDPIRVWGDGSARRDFIHADDVARGMLLAMEELPQEPINLGSGEGSTIRQLVDIIAGALDRPPQVEWDASRPSGDRTRIMDITRARLLGWAPQVSLEEGVRSTVAWYRAHHETAGRRFDVFASSSEAPLLP